MAVLKTRLEWYKKKGTVDAEEITDWTKINIRIGMELKNNMMTIDLKNNFGRNTARQFVGTDNKVAGSDKSYFQVDDVFKIYCKYDKDNTGLDLTDESNDLIFVGG